MLRLQSRELKDLISVTAAKRCSANTHTIAFLSLSVSIYSIRTQLN